MVAVTDPYASASEYRAAVEKTDTAADAEIDADLTAVSRWLDKRLNRHFTQSPANEARVFYPRVMPAYNRPIDWAESENPWLWGGFARWLFIDDLTTCVSITMDLDADGGFTNDTPLNATDFQLFPLNADKGPEPHPYTSVFIPTWSSTVGGFITGRMVQVVGTWGWPSVPQAIKRAAIQITAIWRLESPRATTHISELGQVTGTSKRAQTIIEDLIDEYARKESLV